MTVEIDHKPLLGLMTTERSSLSPRLASIRLDLLSYSLRLVHGPGKEIVLVNTLSRTSPARLLLHEDLGTDPLLQVCNVVTKSQETSWKYARAAESDEELSVVLQLIKNGWLSFNKGCSKRALSY